jgi:hypothetical protein
MLSDDSLASIGLGQSFIDSVFDLWTSITFSAGTLSH